MRLFVKSLLYLLTVSAAAAQNDLFVGNNSSFVTNTYSSGASTFSDLYIGNEVEDAHNSVIISNNTTTFGVTRYARVGWAGSGNSLHILDGARMDAGYGAFVGYMTSSTNNSLVVAGSGSRLFADLHVGYDGSHNTLIVSNGGMFSGYLSIGGGEDARGGNEQSGNSNTVIVTGVGSHLQAEWILVGASGSFNRLIVSNGALLSGVLRSSWFYPSSSNNIIHITGTNSVWDANSGVYYENSIFDTPGSQLLVTDGATLVSTNGADVFSKFQIGGYSGKGNFDILVDGQGSLMHHYRLVIGNTLGDVCHVTVSGGGRIETTHLETSTDASTILTITDPDSHLMLYSGALFYGDASLVVSNGATAAGEGVSLRSFPGVPKAPKGILDGAGSRLQLKGLHIANAGSQLTVKNGATLLMQTPSFVSSGNPYVWIMNAAIVDIGGFNKNDAAGNIITPFIRLDDGVIRFNQTNTTHLNTTVEGNGEIMHLGSGTTILSGQYVFGGETIVERGQLILSNTSDINFEIGSNGANNVIMGNGALFADGTFTFNLGNASQKNGDSWKIVDVPSCVYGPNFRVKDFVRSDQATWDRLTNQTLYRFDQENGTLSVVSGSTNIPYNHWTTIFPSLENMSPAADPDGDGYSNLQEFAFNGSPVEASPPLLRIESIGSDAKISFIGRRNPSEVAYHLMTTTNLSDGTWQTNTSLLVIESADQSGVAFPESYVRREFTVPASGRSFFMIKAEILQ